MLRNRACEKQPPPDSRRRAHPGTLVEAVGTHKLSHVKPSDLAKLFIFRFYLGFLRHRSNCKFSLKVKYAPGWRSGCLFKYARLPLWSPYRSLVESLRRRDSVTSASEVHAQGGWSTPRSLGDISSLRTPLPLYQRCWGQHYDSGGFGLLLEMETAWVRSVSQYFRAFEKEYGL